MEATERPAAERAEGTGERDGTRARLVKATAMLLQRQGYEATTVKQILKEAGAAYGSLYHFFPQGKEELAAEALRFGADDFADLLRRGLAAADDPADAVADCALSMADALRTSAWLDGCPVAATALEIIDRSPLIQRASDEALRQWRELIAAKLRSGGLPRDTAAALACTVLSTLEGAELLSRVSGDDSPMRFAAEHLATLVRASR